MREEGVISYFAKHLQAIPCCKKVNSGLWDSRKKVIHVKQYLSSKPSPLIALALNIWNVLLFNASKPKAWCT